MPGPVIQGHAKVEEDCRRCHVPFDRAAQNGLCLECHKETAADVRGQQGFHGRLEPQPCRACHTEHKGRDARIAPLDPGAFDHSRTDFALHGAHAEGRVACRSCHVAGKKYREAPAQCIACHAKDDAHKGRLGRACGDCHGEASWKETRFDHTKTRFPLRGSHQPLKCESCHKHERYRETPTTCVGCHRQDDRHKGRFGDKCESCHGERAWNALHFNHDVHTRYALRGRHRAAKCESCHTGHLYRDKLQSACIACHAKDDRHRGSLGNACATCHTEASWKVGAFDHARTRFPLRGKHAPLECRSCHRSAVFKEAPSACIGCHRKDDKHRGTLGEACASCHTERSWKETSFDHGRTRFALAGRHARAKCESCHRDADFRRTPSQCNACHAKEDVHAGQQGNRCDSCHDARAWKGARFDHGRARFALVGRHLTVQCKGCHATQRFKDAPGACVACHARADVHKKRLGPRCDGCHNARSWAAWDYSHTRQTRFPLDGAHRRLDCYACHRRPVEGRPLLATSCASCHGADDVHSGAFGRQCEACHVTASFKQIRPNAGRRK